MNIFDEIAGKKGELLAVAVLRYLIVRSSVFREAFIDLVSDHAPDHPLTVGPVFSCLTEQRLRGVEMPDEGGVAEKGGKEDKGRIDLLIQTHDSLIGIEAKLYAAFQDDQIPRYRAGLEAACVELNAANTSSAYQQLLVLLVPRQRALEASAQGVATITWDEVRKAFEGVKDRADATARVFFTEWAANLSRALGWFDSFAKRYPFIIRPLHRNGHTTPNDLQYEFVGQLYNFLPEGWERSKRININRSGGSYLGYSAWHEESERGEKSLVWLGLVDARSFGIKATEATVLIVAASLEVAFPAGGGVQKVDVPQWEGFGLRHCWRIEMQPSWASNQHWADVLEPISSL